MNPERLLQNFDRLIDTQDAVPRLRRFILDLAVRGKLVEQNPEDEPAAELLKRIEEEKKRLVEEGTIKEAKPLQLIDNDEILFDAPAGWKWIRLGNSVNSHLGGGTPSKSNPKYWDGDIYWASVKDIGKTKYVDQTIDRITEAGLKNSSSNLILPRNLIVVTRMGLGKLSINRVPMAINQDLRALSLTSLGSIDFYYIFFKTASYEGTGLTVKGIKVDELLNFPFPLPPLAEQHRIVAKVDELMKLCDELEAAQAKRERRRDRLVAATLHGLNNGINVSFPLVGNPSEERFRASRSDINFEDSARFYFNHLPRLTTRREHIQQLCQTILNLAVRGKLVPQDQNDEPAIELLERILVDKARLVKEGKIRKQLLQAEIEPAGLPFSLPESWVWVRLGDIIHLVSGQHLQPNEYSADKKNGLPYITGPADFGQYDLVITRYALVRKAVAKKGQILLTVKGAGVGKTAICDLPEVAISRQLMSMTAIEWSQRFLLLITHRLAEMLKESARSLIPGISREDVDQFIFALPPLAEQHRIVARVDELMKLCDELETRITTTATARRRLLRATLHEALDGCIQAA